jgi:hypothetical protein
MSHHVTDFCAQRVASSGARPALTAKSPTFALRGNYLDTFARL